MPLISISGTPDPRDYYQSRPSDTEEMKLHDGMMLKLIPRIEELCAAITVKWYVSHLYLVLLPAGASPPRSGSPYVAVGAGPGAGYRVEYPTVTPEGRRGRTARATAHTLDEACALILVGMERCGGAWGEA